MTAKNLYPWLIDFAICIGGLGLGVLVYALFFDTTEIGGRHSAPPPPDMRH